MKQHLRLFLIGLFALTFSLVIGLQACSVANTSDSAQPDTFAERMAEQHQDDTPVSTDLAQQAPAQSVRSEMVDYATLDEQTVEGFLTQPEAAGPHPGIIAIHEWWGLNDNIKMVSERLAGEGYTVLAVDLYSGEQTDKPEKAKQLLQAVMENPDPAKENLRQAYQYLVQKQAADKVGSIGWCFGGAWSLNTGLLLPDELDALVIYYGRLETDPAVLKPLKMPIAGFFGGQDQGIPVADVQAFEAALQSLGNPPEIQIYEDADHAFANPSGQKYEPAAAADAWEKTKAFFERTLKA